MSNPAARKRKEKETPAPIIIVKRGGRHKGGHHGGAWKVAYADFVTTMMALFIVLWAAGQSTKLRQSIASYFRTAAATAVTTGDGTGVLPSGTGIVGAAEARTGPTDADGQNLEKAAEKIRQAVQQDQALKELSSQVQVAVSEEGLRIQMVEKDESLLFEIGSAQLKPALVRLLKVVADVVGQLPNEVIVEGHTDSRQYSAFRGGYSNWELSAERANSARRALETSGLRPRQVIRVVGFADHDLLVPDNPLEAQNRRVGVIVWRMKGNATPEKPSEALEKLKQVPPQVPASR